MAKGTTHQCRAVNSRSNITRALRPLPGRSGLGKTEHQEKLKMSMAQLHDRKRPIYDFAKEETGQDIMDHFPLGPMESVTSSRVCRLSPSQCLLTISYSSRVGYQTPLWHLCEYMHTRSIVQCSKLRQRFFDHCVINWCV
jgi:hypothetical protein